MAAYEPNPCCLSGGRPCQWVAVGRTMHFRVDGTATWEVAMECRVCGVVRTTNGSNALGVVNPETRLDFPADEFKDGGG